MSVKLGLDAKLFRNTGSYGTPGWNEITNVKDLTLTLEAGEADVTTRGNNGWKATVATLKDASIEFEMVWDTADAGFTAIKNAYLTNAPIGFQVRDGVGGQGLQADFMITQFSRSEPLEEAISVSVTSKVTYSTTPPSWI